MGKHYWGEPEVKKETKKQEMPIYKAEFTTCPNPKCKGELYKFGVAGKKAWYQCKKCCRKVLL